MVARIQPRTQIERGEPNRRRLNEKNVLTLPARSKQYLVWDDTRGKDAANGLAVLVSPRGIRSFRCVYYFPGSSKPHWRNLGRVGEVTLEEARQATRSARAMARAGQDPRADDPTRSDSFDAAFREFIVTEQIGRRQNKSAPETEKFVLANFGDWKPRAVATLTYREIDSALARIRDGDPDKGTRPRASASIRLHAHLRDFFGWCARRQMIKTSPMADMPSPATAAGRDRHFGDAEIRAIWAAANELDPAEGAYVKLIMLTALRRDELAKAQWSEFDDPKMPTVLTVPTERVKLKAATKLKKKPVYVVPLSAYAARILRGLSRSGDRVFPGLTAGRVAAKMVKAGAPADFGLHLARHTVATWFQNRGRSEWERGLVLNHAGGGSVTGGYSHGYPVELKRQMLEEWADHVVRLVEPADGVVLLR